MRRGSEVDSGGSLTRAPVRSPFRTSPMSIKSLRIPTLAHWVLEVVRQTEASDEYFERILASIEACPGLALDVLSMSQSANFGGGNSEVRELREALTRVGARHFVANSIKGHLSSLVRELTPPVEELWNRSIAVGAACRLIAKRHKPLGISPTWAETLGRLHNVGSLILAHKFGSEYERVLADAPFDDADRMKAEQAATGLQHYDVVRKMGERWILTKDVESVLSGYTRKESARTEANPTAVRLVQLGIHVAEWMLVDVNDTARTRISDEFCGLADRMGLPMRRRSDLLNLVMRAQLLYDRDRPALLGIGGQRPSDEDLAALIEGVEGSSAPAA